MLAKCFFFSLTTKYVIDLWSFHDKGLIINGFISHVKGSSSNTADFTT